MAFNVPKRSSTPICPSLPPEIWITILTHHTDLLHLWTTCRLVSRSLRACVEQAFPLHEMKIHFQLEKYNLGGRQKRPEVPVLFDRALKTPSGQELAVFRDKRPRAQVLKEDCDGMIFQKLILKRHRSGRSITPASGNKKSNPAIEDEYEQEKYNLIMSRWEENILWPKPELPNYTICLRGMVNDTALHGLALDRGERSVSFGWKEAVCAFVREERYIRDMLDGGRKKKEKKKDEQRGESAITTKKNDALSVENTTPGLDESPEGRKHEPDLPISESSIRVHVRRARLKQHYANDEMMCWAIDSLKHFEPHGSMNSGTAKAMKVNLQLPGAGLGERWWGRTNIVQELYLDEWSCMQRIEMRREEAAKESVDKES